MRQIRINGTPPADWVEEANEVTRQLREAADEEARKAIIKKHENLWRDNRIRNWLLEQFNNKCWYSESIDSTAAVHVDHYRPKGRVKEMPGGESCEGYWWLAFDWTNYRICGQLLNVKKGDLFPLAEGVRCSPDHPESIYLEAPLLIDPISDQARLISYEIDEEGCRAIPTADIDEKDEQRALKTIEILGLNIRHRLNVKRRSVWDDCLSQIAKFKGINITRCGQALKILLQEEAKLALKRKIEYSREFSSVAEACIEKEAPIHLKRMVFESGKVY